MLICPGSVDVFLFIASTHSVIFNRTAFIVAVIAVSYILRNVASSDWIILSSDIVVFKTVIYKEAQP